jgi:FkbM family methyltransferase
MRKLIRNFLNKRGYDIIKTPYKGKRFPNTSSLSNLNFYETPAGNYYLPSDSLKDDVADTMSRGKIFEPEVVELAEHYIKEESTVLDIGANFGQMTTIFSRLAGAKGKVYAFEAQDKVYDVLIKNLKANSCDNVLVLNDAVHKEGGLTLVFPEPDFTDFNPYGSNAINPKLSEGRKVKTITIDSLNIQTPISFIKIDIQGCDLFAMQGAKQTILKYKPAILFEYEEQFQQQFETSFQDYVDFVNEINYRFEKTILEINYLIVPK